ncbi:sulfite exporter TauE/SafE family protein [Amycolatopsis sp. VS8301801F10]|uniref:sulfite exporter TauE/SafE family protein n=1 Tax=Amycolatopsis sp. VS8301801F10 TaxID=2652442 RepID=UPI0038FBF040
MPRPQLHGTSTVVNIAVTAVGSAAYAIGGGVIDLRYGGGMIVGGVLGGFYGARYVARIPENVLRILFLLILSLTSLKLYATAAGVDPFAGSAALPPAALHNPWTTVPITFVAGVLIGAWAGALGLGGGLLSVPALVLLFVVELHTAEGTSLLMFPNAIAGSIVHLRQGTARPRLALLLNLGAIPGAVAGALIGLSLNETALGVIFGTLTLTMALREIANLVRSRPTRPHPGPDAG